MENAILIYPNNKEESKLYKQLAKSLHNRMEIKGQRQAKKKEQTNTDAYFENEKNRKEIEEGIKDMEEGRVTRIKDINNIWESIS